jgi:hypothetical protein
MPALTGIGIQFKGQVIGIEAVRPIEYENTQRVLTDNAMKFFDSRFFKMVRQIHRGSFALRDATERDSPRLSGRYIFG